MPDPLNLELPFREPKVITDGGPWVIHDQPCAVCKADKAVLDIATGIFHPCWRCQDNGWRLRRKRWRWRR